MPLIITAGLAPAVVPPPAGEVKISGTAYEQANVTMDDAGTLKGIITDAGAVYPKPGILDSNGARHAKPGVLDANGARTPIGVLASNGEWNAEAVLQNVDDVYVAYALTSPQSVPYKTGAAAQLATDKDAVAAELANMTTAVQNLLDADNDGQIDMSDYTLTAGIVWPAEANVSDIETAWGPTGAEYAGELDMSLYTLISGVTFPDPGNVSDVETEYGIGGTGEAGTMDVAALVAAGYADGEAAQKVTDSEFLEDHKDEIITSDTDILGEFGVTGTAAGGALSRVRLGM